MFIDSMEGSESYDGSGVSSGNHSTFGLGNQSLPS